MTFLLNIHQFHMCSLSFTETETARSISIEQFPRAKEKNMLKTKKRVDNTISSLAASQFAIP